MNGKCCLTIAGSDSGGNAGVQADLRAFHAYGIHGCTVFNALTAQNPSGVAGILEVPPDFVAKQLDAVLGTYSIGAAKTGMMSSPAAIETVASRMSTHPEIPLVVDPVMVATSGAKLVTNAAMEAAIECLYPAASVLTPNIPEAVILSERKADAETMALAIAKRFGTAALVKGGHLCGDCMTDVLATPDGRIMPFTLPKIENPASTHGTGCTLSAAIACELALGRDLPEAIRGAKAFVHSAIAGSYPVGPAAAVLDMPNLI